MPFPLLLKLSLAVTQEVRIEKEGIERRIDDLAQDAAGKLNEQPLLPSLPSVAPLLFTSLRIKAGELVGEWL